MRGFLAALSFSLLATLALPGCRSSNECSAGGLCACSGGHECYLDCNGDGCNQSCSSMDSCGTVCQSGCSSTCSGTSECSQYCAGNCSIACSGTPTCGIICGAGCNIDCRNAGTCGVQVGPGSTVNCQSVGQCVVECSGQCVITHGDGPMITCVGGGAVLDCSPGVSACGACPT
ncbi:MAG TPA: hypothetical protein VGM29_13270 [Polyangiaceae bacterium]